MQVVNFFFRYRLFIVPHMSNLTETDHSPWQKIYLHLFQFLQCKTERRHIHGVKTSKSTGSKLVQYVQSIRFLGKIGMMFKFRITNSTGFSPTKL